MLPAGGPVRAIYQVAPPQTEHDFLGFLALRSLSGSDLRARCRSFLGFRNALRFCELFRRRPAASSAHLSEELLNFHETRESPFPHPIEGRKAQG